MSGRSSAGMAWGERWQTASFKARAKSAIAACADTLPQMTHAQSL